MNSFEVIGNNRRVKRDHRGITALFTAMLAPMKGDFRLTSLEVDTGRPAKQGKIRFERPEHGGVLVKFQHAGNDTCYRGVLKDGRGQDPLWDDLTKRFGGGCFDIDKPVVNKPDDLTMDTLVGTTELLLPPIREACRVANGDGLIARDTLSEIFRNHHKGLKEFKVSRLIPVYAETWDEDAVYLTPEAYLLVGERHPDDKKVASGLLGSSKAVAEASRFSDFNLAGIANEIHQKREEMKEVIGDRKAANEEIAGIVAKIDTGKEKMNRLRGEIQAIEEQIRLLNNERSVARKTLAEIDDREGVLREWMNNPLVREFVDSLSALKKLI